MFRTVANLKPRAFSKVCQTWKMIRQIPSQNIKQAFSRIFRNIQRNWSIFIHSQKLWFWKKVLIVSIFGLYFSFKMCLCSCVVFYLCFWRIVHQSTVVPKNLPCPKSFWLCNCTKAPFFCKTLYLNCLKVFWIRLCLSNCSVICTVTLWCKLFQPPSEYWHIQSSIYSCIFRHIQEYSASLRHSICIYNIY